MKICVTGHRPSKLYGYDLTHPKWIALKEKFKEILVENHCEEAITGMALGVDTVFALAVLELKAAGYPIKLHCAVPCLNHPNKWPKESIDMYNDILSKADIVKVVSNTPYHSWVMQKRNECMVDLSEKVIAVWTGAAGGTANCVRYARECEKEIIQIVP